MSTLLVRDSTSASINRAGRVLVVDDNPMNRELAAYMLLQLRFAVVIAENGLQALEALDVHRVDVVLMDCDMPVMDGLQATIELRRREALRGASSIPVIAYTANDSKESRDQCLRAGMNGFLGKPLTQEHLASALAPFLAEWSVLATDATDNPCSTSPSAVTCAHWDSTSA